MALAKQFIKALADGHKISRTDIVGGGFMTFGNVYYVVESSEANYTVLKREYDVTYNDGSNAFCSTVDEAMGKCVSGRDDIIVLSANVSNKVTAMLAVSKNRVHFVGTGFAHRKIGSRSLISNTGAGAATDVAMVYITGTGCSFHDISFKNNWTAAENLFSVQDYGIQTFFENCDIENLGSAHLTNNAAASLNAAGSESIFENCTLGQDTLLITSTGGQQVLITAKGAGTKCTRTRFVFCRFQAWTSDTTHVFIRAGASTIDRDVTLDHPEFCNTGALATSGVTLAVAVATNSGVGGAINVISPAIFRCSDLATASVGATGVFVVSPVLAAAASDCVAVQSS